MSIARKSIFVIRWFFISVFCIVGTTAMLFYWNYEPPTKIEQQACEPQILKYSLGNIDSHFNLKNEAIIGVLKDSEKMWNEPLGYNILEYSPESDFKINFVYDARQKYVEKTKEYNQRYDQLEQSQANTRISKQKLLIDEFDAYENKFKNTLDSTGRYAQGEMGKNEINIYAFENEEDLKNLLAHEFGHAFGIEDNQDTYSIMNGIKNDNSPMVTSEDLKKAKEFCTTSKIWDSKNP